MVTRTKTKETEVVELTPTQQQIVDEVDSEVTQVEALEKLVETTEKMGLYENPVNPMIKDEPANNTERTQLFTETVQDIGYQPQQTPMMLLVSALAKARAEFDAVTKNANNPFFKSKYADLSEVIGAITPALSANGLVVVQPIEQTENGLLLRTQLYHVGGGVIESTFAIPENKDIQKLGSAITYVRRYSLSSLIGVAPQDDDGNAAAGKKVEGENIDELIKLYETNFNKIENCKNIDDLKTLWLSLKLTQGSALHKLLEPVKNIRRTTLYDEIKKTKEVSPEN